MVVLLHGARGARNAWFRVLLFFGLLVLLPPDSPGQTAYNLRIMAANLNGNTQSYQPFALRIFQGLKPDVVAIQEFNYGGNTAADFRSLLDTAFGTNFVYYREPGAYSIPNAVISRYPILSAGSWNDPKVSDRGIAWAQIGLPGTNDLYVVSAHLYGSGTSADRNAEAAYIKSNIMALFPANAWVVVAGDFNTSVRTEPAVDTFKSILSDSPIPTDAEAGGDPDTNANRNKPYDYVLPSFSLAVYQTNSVFASHSFSNGLVFDSRVYTPLSDVAPVLMADSGNAQHMGVIKDFRLIAGSNAPGLPAAIVSQPLDQTSGWGSNATFQVRATGSDPLAFTWRFFGTNIPGSTASSFTRTNVTDQDAGPYCVVVSNFWGAVTSSVVTLAVNPAPSVLAPPANRVVGVGQDAQFTVTAGGQPPLGYQWQFNGTPIASATSTSYTRLNAQPEFAGLYAVVVSNDFGSITSAAAILTVTTQSSAIIVQWNFNSAAPDTNTTTGITTPSAGSGAASLVGGTSASFAGGSSTDIGSGSDNSGWNSSTYPAQGTGNKTAGVQFSLSTLGRQNIRIRWDQKASNTGSKYSRFQYTTNGSNFIDWPTPITLQQTTNFEPQTNSLAGLPGVDNNPNFAFRIVAEYDSTANFNSNANYVATASASSYGTGGTLRYDMVTVSGEPIPTGTPPGILSPPQDRVVVAGSNVVLKATATGSAPLHYQWQREGDDLPGATSADLTLNDVTAAQAGSYRVVITNSAGSVASPYALLSVYPTASPILGVTHGPATSVQVEVSGVPGFSYALQVSSDLLNWAALQTNTSPFTFTDTNSPGLPSRFYRAVWVP